MKLAGHRNIMVNVESQVLYVWSRAVNERPELHSSIWSVRMCFKEFMSGASGIFTPISLIRN